MPLRMSLCSQSFLGFRFFDASLAFRFLSATVQSYPAEPLGSQEVPDALPLLTYLTFAAAGGCFSGSVQLAPVAVASAPGARALLCNEGNPLPQDMTAV